MVPFGSLLNGIGRSLTPAGELWPGVHRAGDKAREDNLTFNCATTEMPDLSEV